MQQLIIEAVVVGIVFAAIGLGVTLAMYKKHHIDNKLQTALPFFITGILGHFLFEYFGANKWYCTHGHACI